MGPSWVPYGVSWLPFGAFLKPSGRLCSSTWSLLGAFGTLLLCAACCCLLPAAAYCCRSGSHCQHSCCSIFFCTTRGSARCTNTPFVPPQGLPTAIVLRWQRNFSSPDGDICNTSITIFTKLLHYSITQLLYYHYTIIVSNNNTI